MAGPSIMVRVLADLTNFGKAAADAGKTAEGAASRMHSAFGTVLNSLNRTGVLGPFGDVLAGINDAIGSVIEHSKDIGPAMIGVGAAITGVGAGLSLMGSKDQAAHQQLQSSIEATGASYEDFAGQVEAAIKHQEKFGTTANTTQDALRTLTQATHDPQKALDLLGTASDLAAAKHEDLNTAAGQLGKVYNGNTKLLKEFGVKIDAATGKTADNQGATQALAGVLQGQASAATDTFAGKLNAVKARLEDGAASMGQKYGPALQTVGMAVMALGTIWTTIGPVIAGMEMATLGPILLIVAAAALLIAAGYLIYRNWSTIWAGIQAVVQVVWNWIKQNWPLLLGILLGPIALAAALIYKYWAQIQSGLAAVWNWIRSAWSQVYSFLVTPIVNAVAAVVRVFQALPGQLGGLFSGLWDGLLTAFRRVINGVIDIWNGLHFTLPKIDLGPLGKLGGESVGVPQIPHLAAGGLITADGLIYAHAGEVISPAPGRTGPAVHVENATFASDIDIDLFMRRAAWVVQTQRV